jgi:hypothetical protein
MRFFYVIQLVIALDEHYLSVIDEQQRRLFSKRLPNSLNHILAALQPFKQELSGW